MLNEISQIAVLAFGAAICALSLWGLILPAKMMQAVYGVVQKDWGIHFAVVIRVVLGAALIIAAAGSRFPLIFEVLGWIAIVAAIALIFLGRTRLRKLVDWFERMPQAMIRIWLIFGFAFGALLVYGVV